MYYVGIDLGGTNIKAGVVDEEGKILSKHSIKTNSDRHYTEILKDMAMIAKKVIEDANLNIEDINSIGVGSPGSPDCKEGVLIYTNNIPFRNVPVRKEIQKYINLPVFLDNDANCAAVAENIAGAAKDVSNSVTITIGTGIGSGVVIDGNIYGGMNYAAAELGHMVIVVDGIECTCGRKGCFERYASAVALVNQSKEGAEANPTSILNSLWKENNGKMSAKIPFIAARQNDATAIKIIEQYIKYLATGITNIINILQPDVIVIGGGVCNEGKYLIDPLKELVASEVYSRPELKQTEIRVAQMGNDAGLIGAAMLSKCQKR